MAADPHPGLRNGDSRPARDPTENVLDALAAAVARIDDLNALRDSHATSILTAEARRVDERRQAESLRIDQMREAESRRVDEQMVLRAHYDDRLATKEADRINAIRAVDVAAVATAAERAAASATILATQVAVQAETLRSLVATTQTASDLRFAQVTSAQTERIAALEKAGNVATGRETRDDPAIAQLTANVSALLAAQNSSIGRTAQATTSSASNQWMIGLIIGGIIAAVEIGLRLTGH